MPVAAIGGIIGAVGSIAGAAMQSSAAKKATKAQVNAANQQLALDREIFDYSKEIQAPFVDAGTMANAILQYEMWGGDAPLISAGGYRVGDTTYDTREEAENALQLATDRFNRASNYRVNTPDAQYQMASSAYDREGGPPTNRPRMPYVNRFDPSRGIEAAGFDPRGASIEAVDPRYYEGFTKTPDYEFAFSEGRNAVESGAAARGGLKSGATLKALTEYGQNFAGLRRDNYLSQLAGLSGRGQQSTNALQNAGNAFAANSGAALANIGNARAAGSIARGNAWSQGMQGALQSIGSVAGQMLGGGGGFGGIGGFP